MSLPEPSGGVAQAASVHAVRILTVNAHKGFSPLNRRYVLPELREAVRSQDADLVFLQEVLGSHRQHASRHPGWSDVPPARESGEFKGQKRKPGGALPAGLPGAELN